ncbi:MAG: ABC transporter permease [Deltaproteobacteria bacterium]|nr:ABC transporter permease [Deltaproteobacteria bacterium]
MKGRRLNLRVGAGITAAVVFVAIAAPMIAPGEGRGGVRLESQLQSPGAGRILGCDENGADLLGRIVLGARVAVLVGVLTVMVSLALGTAIGAMSGYLGGPVDELFMRVVDVLMSFPGVLLAIGIIAVTQSPSYASVVCALSATGWVGYARMARAQAQVLRGREFVLAAEAMGASPMRIVAAHLVPNMLAPLIVQATFGMAGAILAEASLSFLGLGPQDSSSWGALLDQGAQYLAIRWHMAVFPGIALFVTVLGLNLFGDGLRDMLDPKTLR